ncbi:MAG: hypothetical protein Q9227_004999 [Pyrenula ochraceoflavens]
MNAHDNLQFFFKLSASFCELPKDCPPPAVLDADAADELEDDDPLFDINWSVMADVPMEDEEA